MAKRWSKQHDRCLRCGTTDEPHHGHGNCVLCYTTIVNERSAAKRRTGAYCPPHVTHCQVCGEPFQEAHPYYEAGRCLPCFKAAPLAEEDIQAWRARHAGPTARNLHRAAVVSASRMGATACADLVGATVEDFRNWCSGAMVPDDFHGRLRELYVSSRTWLKERW